MKKKIIRLWSLKYPARRLAELVRLLAGRRHKIWPDLIPHRLILKSLIILILLHTFIAHGVKSQNYEFRVLANKGENMYKSNTKDTDWSPLRTGERLNKGSILKIGSASYLGMTHATGKTLELKKAGTYKIDELSAKLEEDDSGILSKYMDFIINKISSTDDDVSKNYKKYQSATGAVKRALPHLVGINIISPTAVEFFDPKLIIRWTELNQEKTPEYEVTFKDKFGKIIKKAFTHETSIPIDLQADDFRDEALVVVSLRVKGNKKLRSDEYGLKRIPEDRRADIRKELESLEKKIIGKSALDQLVLASFYEEKGLFLDALKYYEKAIQLAPEVGEFKWVYEKFLENSAIGR